MKSALRQVMERRILFHLKSQAEDFIQTCLDFILQSRISFLLFFRIVLYLCREVIIMAENKLADLSMDFAVKILKMTDGIKGHYSLVNQLEHSSNPKN